MFKAIVIIYCLVGLFYNVMLVPRKNKLIYEQNQFILDRYKQMEKTLDRLEKALEGLDGKSS